MEREEISRGLAAELSQSVIAARLDAVAGRLNRQLRQTRDKPVERLNKLLLSRSG